MDRSRSTVFLTLFLILVCGPCSGLLIARASMAARERRWASAGGWAAVLAVFWTASAAVAVSVFHLKARGL